MKKVAKLSLVIGLILFATACIEQVTTPNKLISDETASKMDQYLKNRTPADIPEDDGLTFGYTYQELEEYMTYLKHVASQKNIELDSVQFVIAAYPPHPERNNKIYRAIYLKPTFKNGEISTVNKAQTNSVGGNENSRSETESNHQEYKTILDMSGCCHTAEFVEEAQK